MATTQGKLNIYTSSGEPQSIMQVKYNGSYVSKVKLNLNPNNNHDHGWSEPSDLGQEYKSDDDTLWNGGYTGTKVIFDYAKLGGNYNGIFPGNPSCYVCSKTDMNSSWYSPNYEYVRDGNIRRSKAFTYSYSWQTAGIPSERGWVPPTIMYDGAGNVGAVISAATDTHLPMSWGNNPSGSSPMPEPYAYKDYTIYRKPWLPDYRLSATFLSTPNQWYPGPHDGISPFGSYTYGTVLLKQPEMWGVIGISNNMNYNGSMYVDDASLYGLWQDWGTQFYVTAYTPITRWDSVADMNAQGIPFTLDINGASNISGTITNFQEMSNFAGYYQGYAPITLTGGAIARSAKCLFGGSYKWQSSALSDNQTEYTLYI